VFVPLAYLALIVYLIVATVSDSVPDLQGGDAAASSAASRCSPRSVPRSPRSRSTFMETSAEHIVDGLVFAFKAMGVVLPIAGFFFLGNGEFAGQIMSLGEGANGAGLPVRPRGRRAEPAADQRRRHRVRHPDRRHDRRAGGLRVLRAPADRSLAGSLSEVPGVSSPTLAAIGQMGNIWSGGGTLVAWSSLLAVAGFVRVPAVELARTLLLPVVAGLVACTSLRGGRLRLAAALNDAQPRPQSVRAAACRRIGSRGRGVGGRC
jgi:hypothetical protein